jgi:hypothetical protein
VLTPAEIDAAGKAGGTQAVNDAFTNGSVTTSTTGQPYTDFYGNYYDQYKAWQQAQQGGGTTP